MTATTSRIYNSTDGPLIIDDEGHVLAARESTRVKSVDVEPIVGHLEAGRLIDTTEAKAEGDEAAEQLEAAQAKAEQEAAEAAKLAEKSKGDKPATPTTRS